MYAKVKLHYIELQQRRLAALEMCSTAKDMVTGPTGETRLVLPSSELRDCRPSGFRSATKYVRHLRFVYVERILLITWVLTSLVNQPVFLRMREGEKNEIQSGMCA